MSDFLALQEYIVKDINSIKYTIKGIIEPIRYKIIKLVQKIIIEDIFSFRQVPNDAASGYATIEQIEGNTVKFNQLVQNGDFSDGTTGWTVSTRLTSSVSNNEATFTANDGTGGANKYIFQSINYISGHKYLISFDWRSNRTSLRLYLSSTLMHIESEIINTWVTFSEILTNNNYDRFGIAFENPDMSVGNYFSLRKIQIIDLTAIFGAGNEPTTVADFEAWLAQNGLPSVADYNAGELLNVKMQSVKSVGFNQWDEEWEVGSINQNTGEKTNSSYKIRSKNYIKVLPSTTYYLCNNTQLSNVSWFVFFYSADGNYLGRTTTAIKNTIFTTPVNCEKILFRENANYYGTTYNNDICINISDPTKNGTYEPYMTDSADIDITTITGINTATNVREAIFPNGMNWLSDSIHDIIDLVNGEATVKCWKDDLTDKVWTTKYTGSVNRTISAALDKLNNRVTSKYLSSKYNFIRNVNGVALLNNPDNIAVGLYPYYNTSFPNDRTCYLVVPINETSFGDVCYELATPITYTDLQDANGNLLKNKYKVENGGTEQILPINTNTPTSVSPKLTTTYTKK